MRHRGIRVRYEYTSDVFRCARRILRMMDSANTDPELRTWLRWASEQRNTPAFVHAVAEAARMACIPDYLLLCPVLLELKRRCPEG